MINMGNYVLIINKLIQKHNLCDENGVPWHFTSKQQRKTLAVTLIENGLPWMNWHIGLGILAETVHPAIMPKSVK